MDVDGSDVEDGAMLSQLKIQNSQQFTWALFLNCINFSITYRLGSHNHSPDALSYQFASAHRCPDPVICLVSKWWAFSFGKLGIEPCNRLSLTLSVFRCRSGPLLSPCMLPWIKLDQLSRFLQLLVAHTVYGYPGVCFYMCSLIWP